MSVHKESNFNMCDENYQLKTELFNEIRKIKRDINNQLTNTIFENIKIEAENELIIRNINEYMIINEFRSKILLERQNQMKKQKSIISKMIKKF